MQLLNRTSLKQFLMYVILAGMITSLTYILIVVFSFMMYNYGSSLPFLDQTTRDLYHSFLIFRTESNTSYRQQFHGYLPPAQKIVGGAGDIYAAYGLPLVAGFQATWPARDTIGWPNTTQLDQAEVLFIGDSFTRGNAAGFDHSIPVYFEKLTGKKTYIAGNEGYGLPQYLEIFSYLTRGFQDQSVKFHGKQVYIVLCIENDVGLDLRRYLVTIAEERRTDRWLYKIAFYFSLVPIRRLLSFNWMVSQEGVARKTITYQYVTPHDEKSIVSEKARTEGWYPHFTTLPAYQNMPFAFFRGNLIDFKDIGWFYERQEYILKILHDINYLSNELGCQVRFIVLPTTLQIVAPYLTSRPSSGSEFDRLFSTILRNVNIVHDLMLQNIRSVGFEVLDVKPIFQQNILSKPLVWPGDIHFTQEGYALIAEHIVLAYHK